MTFFLVLVWTRGDVNAHNDVIRTYFTHIEEVSVIPDSPLQEMLRFVADVKGRGVHVIHEILIQQNISSPIGGWIKPSVQGTLQIVLPSNVPTISKVLHHHQIMPNFFPTFWLPYSNLSSDDDKNSRNRVAHKNIRLEVFKKKIVRYVSLHNPFAIYIYIGKGIFSHLAFGSFLEGVFYHLKVTNLVSTVFGPSGRMQGLVFQRLRAIFLKWERKVLAVTRHRQGN